ncbi:MAG: hypothetical protein M1438_15875 [Deltaproteobacteria bacterium]|nr:hypothetical protein [Deltaproteobacteria bacterium]
MWALVVVLLLVEWRLKRPGISWLPKWALVKGKLTEEQVRKARDACLKLDRGFIRVVQALLIILSVATSVLFLFSDVKKSLLLLSFICWVIIPFYFLCHLVVRTDKLSLERLGRMVAERQGEGKLET